MSWHREELLKDDGLKETQLSSEQRYDGYFMNVQRDTVELPNGQTSTREYMKHPGAVMIIPVFDNGDVLLERQFRYPLHQVFVEFPAGKMDGGELPLQTAHRELLEETGYTASEWQHVTSIHNAIAYCDEVIHFYLARGLVKRDEQKLDDNEFLQTMRVPFGGLELWVKQGWVADVKTQLGMFWLKDMMTQK